MIASAILFSGCEKHAYTISTNVFMASTGSSYKTMGADYSLRLGKTAYIIAAESDKTHFGEGRYEVSISDSGEQATPACVEVSTGKYKGENCIVVKAIARGKSDVNLNFYVNNFHLYKTVSFNVK